MPAEPGCTWLGTGPAMKIHWDRLKWNLKHLLDFKTRNPFLPAHKNRTGLKDVFHSMVNISTEFARACPYRAGHIIFWEKVTLILVVIGLFSFL